MSNPMTAVSSILIAVFVVLATAHLVMAYHRIVGRRPGFSAVPNGVIGAAGIAMFPSTSISSRWWLPFLIDWGCVPLLLEMLVASLGKRAGGL